MCQRQAAERRAWSEPRRELAGPAKDSRLQELELDQALADVPRRCRTSASTAAYRRESDWTAVAYGDLAFRNIMSTRPPRRSVRPASYNESTVNER